MSRRSKLILDSDTVLARQDRIVDIPGYRAGTLMSRVHPPVEREVSAFAEILKSPDTNLGIDLEFPPSLVPTIVSVTTLDRIVSVPWDKEVAELLKQAFQNNQHQWVAHSGISADKPVVEQAFKFSTDLNIWEDSMVTHYLCNQHLTKAPTKEASDDSGAMGFMNLWTMASLTTDMYNWKECRGVCCDGPCPQHDPIGYCGVDAWAGLYGFTEHLKLMERYKIPYLFYRDAMEIGEICYLMEKQGIKVDVPLVQEMEANFEAQKAALFPGNIPFNPKSNIQVLEWFTKHAPKFGLKSNEKKEIFRVMEKQLKQLGFATVADMEQSQDELPPEVEILCKLHDHKSAGKGFKAWFDEKYLTPEHLVHPRFISVGTTTARLASSRPNFMNIPVRNFGALVRRAIIPRNPDMDLLKSDSKQLELRVALFLAGENAAAIGADAFNWLVAESKGQFLTAAEYANPTGYAEDPAKTARGIAKIVSYASLYMAGFKLYDFDDLETKRIKNELDMGALRIYTRKWMPRLSKDWLFHGKVVGFTGKRLAEELFRDASNESRAKALKVQEDVYFNRFFKIREWQMRVLEEVEATSAITTPLGRYVRLYGPPEDQAKAATSVLGQGVGADHIQGIMLRYKREFGAIPLLQVHDELVFEIPSSWTDLQARDFIQPMNEETSRLPGLVVPADAKRGKNWKDLRELIL